MSDNPIEEAPWVREDIEPLTHVMGNEYQMNWRTVWIGTDRMSVRLRQHQGGIGLRLHINNEPVGDETIVFTPDMQFEGDTPDD